MNPFKQFKFLLLDCITERSIQDLQYFWNQKTRFYHNTSHLIQIIKDIELNIWFGELYPFEKRILLVAVFMHDAICDPKKSNNEDESIEFFKYAWKRNDEFEFREIIKLIEATKHRKRPITKLAKILWDADNAGFKKGYMTLLKNEKLIPIITERISKFSDVKKFLLNFNYKLHILANVLRADAFNSLSLLF